MYYLGIDGGGTKTAFVLINNKGNILAEIEKKHMSSYASRIRWI